MARNKDLLLLHCDKNDEIRRHNRDIAVRDDYTVSQMLAKYRNCNHLFVVVGKQESGPDGEPIPEQVECVHCGLTNRLIKIEDAANERDHHIREYYDYGIKVRTHSYVTEEFVHQFGWRGEGLDEQQFLSKEEFSSWHPGILFQIASELFFPLRSLLNIGYGINSKTAIFLIMEELRELETPLEQIKISSVVHASALIERFKKKHNLYQNISSTF